MPRSASVRIKASYQQRKTGSTGGVAAASLGRSVNKYHTSDFGELPQVVAESLRNTVQEHNQDYFFRVKALDLAKHISDNIDKELLKVGQFMTTHLMGRTSEKPYGESTEINVPQFDEVGIDLEWRNLANITVRKKTANKRKFFMHHGDLRSELRKDAGPGLVKLNHGFKTGKTFNGGVAYGSVRIRPDYYELDTGKRVYKIADIEVNLLAGVKSTSLAAVAEQRAFDQYKNTSGNLPEIARLMGLSPMTVKKLEGGVIDRHRIKRRNKSGFKIGSFWENDNQERAINFYRPMLEPTLAYFFQARVPRAVERALARYRRAGERIL